MRGVSPRLEKWRHDLEVDHVFKPTYWSRTKLVISLILSTAVTTLLIHSLLKENFFSENLWSRSGLITEVILTMVFARIIFYAVLRLSTISVTIGQTTIIYWSLFKKISIAYVNVTKILRVVTRFPTVYYGIHIWHSGGTFFVNNYEFTESQLIEMEILINRHLAALTLVEPKTISLDKK